MSGKVRFAPSPTGHIHIGNARTALLNWIYCLKEDAQFLLRFDDTDKERSRQEYAETIADNLDWLGIKPHEIAYQSKRVDKHDDAAQYLKDQGLLYPCYETPEELDRKRKIARASGRPPIYDRAALQLSDDERAKLEAEGRTPHWRFKLQQKELFFDDLVRGQQKVDTSSMSDPVLIRADGNYLYTLPSVVDDTDLGITHVIRGEDHVSNTGVQIELIEALGGTVPTFAHHNLLTAADGEGLSKRKGSLSISQLSEQGFEALTISLYATLIGTSLPVFPYGSLADMAQAFSFSDITQSAAKFDPEDLKSFNGKILQQMTFEQIKDQAVAQEIEIDEALWMAIRGNISFLKDIEEWSAVIHGSLTSQINSEDRAFITQARNLLPEEPWDETTWDLWTQAVKDATGRKGKALFKPLRLALTGLDHGPELKTILPLIGRTGSIDRLS